MTTLNTIIEEEKKKFRSIGSGSVRFIATREEVCDFLTTAMQRAYEAGRAEAEERGYRKAIRDFDDDRDTDSCECDNCFRWRKFSKKYPLHRGQERNNNMKMNIALVIVVLFGCLVVIGDFRQSIDTLLLIGQWMAIGFMWGYRALEAKTPNV